MWSQNKRLLWSRLITIVGHYTYVGRYELATNFVLTISKAGEKLTGQASGEKKSFELSPESDTKFYVREVNARVTFVKDDQGTVTGLIFRQNGQDLPGNKIVDGKTNNNE